MSGNKCAKYVVPRAMRAEDFMDEMAAGFMTMPPLIFLDGDVPVKGPISSWRSSGFGRWVPRPPIRKSRLILMNSRSCSFSWGAIPRTQMTSEETWSSG